MLKLESVVLIALFAATIFVGCSQDAEKKDGAESADSTAATQSTKPEADLATQTPELPQSDATAKKVCESFLNLLAHDERLLAEQLLTRTALKVTGSAGLELESLGGPDSKVVVQDAMYATSAAKVAQVPCTVTEKGGARQSFLWLLRREQSGWRISGLIVDMGKSQELLSFENKSDVASILASRGGSTGSGDVRLVSATDDE